MVMGEENAALNEPVEGWGILLSYEFGAHSIPDHQNDMARIVGGLSGIRENTEENSEKETNDTHSTENSHGRGRERRKKLKKPKKSLAINR